MRVSTIMLGRRKAGKRFPAEEPKVCRLSAIYLDSSSTKTTSGVRLRERASDSSPIRGLRLGTGRLGGISHHARICADSEGSRPRIRDDVAHHSDLSPWAGAAEPALKM